MKIGISILIAIVILAGGWFGISTWNRQRLLDSGRVLLLVNAKAAQYTYSDLVERDDIDRSWKIIGYADELSEEKITAATQGLSFIQQASIGGGDARVPRAVFPEAATPDADQSQAWASVLASLDQPQVDLCAIVPSPALSQYCVVRHFVMNALKQGLGHEACAGIFVEEHRLECEEHLVAKDLALVPDSDGNNLIDTFQIYGEINTEALFNEYQRRRAS